MSESMIERAARRIANEMHAGGDFGMTGEDAYLRRSAEFLALARAAIEAMRSAPEHLAADLRLDGQHIASYHDIIDAALNEQVAG